MFRLADISSDFSLAHQYLSFSDSVIVQVSEVNDTRVQNKTSLLLGGAATRTCDLINEEDALFNFQCHEQHYWFGIATLMFIYTPSLNIISAFYGTKITGFVSNSLSVGSIILGVILSIIGILTNTSRVAMVGHPTWILGLMIFAIGNTMTYQHEPSFRLNFGILRSRKEVSAATSFLHWLCFPILFVSSPVLFLVIRIIMVLKPNNEFVQNQSRVASKGESMLEATPQLGLQLFVVMTTLSATENQWIALVTSALTFTLDNIKYFLYARGKEGFNLILYLPIFFLVAIFKVISVSLIFTFIHFWTLIIVALNVWIIYPKLRNIFLNRFTDPSLTNTDDENKKRNEDQFLSWITLTSLLRGKHMVIMRICSSYYYFLFYSSMLLVILIICNTNSSWVSVLSVSGFFQWNELPLVLNLTYLNVTIGATIGIGALAFLVDLIIYRKCGPFIHEMIHFKESDKF